MRGYLLMIREIVTHLFFTCLRVHLPHDPMNVDLGSHTYQFCIEVLQLFHKFCLYVIYLVANQELHLFLQDFLIRNQLLQILSIYFVGSQLPHIIPVDFIIHQLAEGVISLL